MSNFVPIAKAAQTLRRHPRTIGNWIASEFIHAYDDGSGKIFVDLDEISRQLKLNRRMRDGRRKFGGVTVVPIPPVQSPAKQCEDVSNDAPIGGAS